MARVKKGKTALKHRRGVLKKAKGYRFGRSKKEKEAKQAITRAAHQARAHRRVKKNDFRRLWQIKIGAASRELGMPYSKFIAALKAKNIELDRKSLADLAENHPESFKAVFGQVS